MMTRNDSGYDLTLSEVLLFGVCALGVGVGVIWLVIG